MSAVVIIGRLGQDPEVKYFESGSVKATLSVAVDRGFKENKTTDWFRVEAWGKLAEIAGEYMKKGTLVSINGSLEVQRWNDQSGNEREMPVIRAENIQMEGSKRDNEQAAGRTSGEFAPF
ncbi:MAG: single-stranded DNA-binding protein [Vampirovibrionales bacterium]|nr:single-stranded DNA-binding protein [Vampirovibrionales bacterium]